MNQESMKSDITLVYPCVKDKTKCIVEASLSVSSINPELLCEVLEKAKEIKDLKCSSKLGLAKFKVNSETITLFKNGRIVVREVDNEEKAIEIIGLVTEIIKPSLVSA